MKANRLARRLRISLETFQENLNNLGYNETISEDTDIPEEIEDLVSRYIKIDEFNSRAEDFTGSQRRNKIRQNFENLSEDCIVISRELLLKLSQSLIDDGIIERQDVISGTNEYEGSESDKYIIYSHMGGYGLLNRFFDHLTSPKYNKIIISKKGNIEDQIYANFEGTWGVLLPELNYLFKPHYDKVIYHIHHDYDYDGYDIGIKYGKYTFVKSHKDQFEGYPRPNNFRKYDYASGFDYGFCVVKNSAGCFIVDSCEREYAYINKKGNLYYYVNKENLKKGFLKILYVKPFYGKEIEEFVFFCENSTIIRIPKDDFISDYRDFIIEEEYNRYLDDRDRYYDDIEESYHSSSMAECWDAMTDGQFGDMPDGFDGDFSFIGR